MKVNQTIPMALRVAYSDMHRVGQKLLATSGVTVEQYVLLRLLAEEDAVTQKNLVERAHSDPGTVAAMLRLLEARGEVRREVCRKDARARRVILTARGRRTHEKSMVIADRIHDCIHSTVSREDREIVIRGLMKISDAMRRMGEIEHENVTQNMKESA